MDIFENISVNTEIKEYLERTYKQPLVSAYLNKKEGVLIYNGIQIPVKCKGYGVCTLETASGESLVFQGGKRRKTRRMKNRRRMSRRMRSTRGRRRH